MKEEKNYKEADAFEEASLQKEKALKAYQEESCRKAVDEALIKGEQVVIERTLTKPFFYLFLMLFAMHLRLGGKDPVSLLLTLFSLAFIARKAMACIIYGKQIKDNESAYFTSPANERDLPINFIETMKTSQQRIGNLFVHIGAFGLTLLLMCYFLILH